MEFRILGPLEVRAGERPVEIGGARQRLLLARLLVASGRVVLIEGLIEELWRDAPSPGARDALHAQVSRLRKALRSAGGREVIRSQACGYVLDPGVDAVDAGRFEGLVLAARQAAAVGEVAAAIVGLREADECWRGPALAEFSEYPFAQAESARLEELRLLATEERIDIELSAGCDGRLVGELEAWVTDHPLRERLWGQLMVALYRSGRQSEALRAYQRARGHLRDELGIEPGAELTHLERAILLQDPALDAPTKEGRVASAGRPAASGNLPAALTSFVGRAEELSRLATLMVDVRMLTLTGLGGVGKTRLALEAAGQAAGYPDGVWLVELAPVADPAFAAHALAGVLGIGEQRGRAIIDTLADALGASRLLVVLDNCEHLVAASATLATALLSACPGVRILATSRVPLRVPGEVVWTVAPLSVPGGTGNDDVALVLRNESVRLLVERARLVRPHLSVADSDVAALVGLCVRLEGIPLAIELVAARASVLSFKQMNARLDDCLRVCATAATTAALRHRSLQATLDWSYELLGGAEKTLLRGASVFSGGFTLEALEALWAGEADAPNLLDLLGSLVEGSLVVMDHDDDGSRYRLLEVVRQYAMAKMDEAEATARRQRHRDVCLAWAEKAEPMAFRSEPASVVAGLVAEHDNFRAALAWSLESGPLDDGGLHLAHALYPLWLCSGHIREGRQWLDAFLAKGSREDVPIVSAVTRRAALLAWESDDYPAASLLSQRALSLALEVGGPPSLLARSMMTAGCIAGIMGDAETERSLLEQALPIGRGHDDLFVGQCLSFLAYAAHRHARYGEARRLAGEVLTNHTDDWLSVGNAHHVLGQVEHEQGNLAAARLHLDRYLALDVTAGGHAGSQYARVELGAVAWAVGDRTGARRHYELALEFGRRAGTTDCVAAALTGLAELAAADRDHDLALSLADEATPWTQATGDVALAAALLSRLGGVRAEAGQVDAADAAYRRALRLAHRSEMPLHLAACMEGLAFVALARGQAAEAARLLGAAGALRTSIGAPPPRTALPSVEDRGRSAIPMPGAGRHKTYHGPDEQNIAALLAPYVETGLC